MLIITGRVAYRIYSINKNIPMKYQKDEYKVRDNIQLDNLNIKVLSVRKDKPKYNNEYKSDRISFYADLEVKVTSKQYKDDIGILKTVTSITKNGMPSNFDTGYEELKSLKVGESTNITLIWDKEPDFFRNKSYVDIYLPKDIYAKEIREKYNNGVLYGKYIRVKVTDD